MDGISWSAVIAVLGVIVPIMAFLYEFIFVGRKRLGYRVQMDTTVADEVVAQGPESESWKHLQWEDGRRLVDPSFVLLRIENNGATNIDTSDYAVLEHHKTGINVRFPGRNVVNMVLTELSDDFIRENFDADSGFGSRGGEIQLPKVPLNRSQYYKILAVLETSDGGPPFDPPEVVGGIKGGVGAGGIKETRSRTGTSGPVIALLFFLVLVIIAQPAVSYVFEDEAPLDCASGELTIVGSTAFSPVLEEAAEMYEDTCPGSSFTIDTQGSTEGLRRLDDAENPEDMLAFSDGESPDGYPMLLSRPMAFSLFTLVINEEAGVQNLSAQQVGQLYEGEIRDWSEIGGNDVPVRLVSRHSDSGTRRTFEQRLLEGEREPGDTSDDCLELAPGASGVPRCERASTNVLLDTVAETPGALGYSEAGTAQARQDLLPVRIDGNRATLEDADYGAYPFWETEYAYTHGEADAESLTASFLRYLTNEVGRDIIRSHGHRPCAELQNPMLCQPENEV
ncbi:ABC-type phosphate transport system substrate-binding protein [Lipingzhangella halophila]|uniref:ABC-type phosphate transport system substrate-binding protein n=1 Tax=Lipingzhangella halophila TaxID=1783352 RepID=A0A7W7W4Y2_9ACTN|nr:substrate-binding domain-containing protein [Lipingzhangella halophila]MBB4933284.1 ABC-type phosphate transport system substrate-binding protein [Lipingzhangella halophila]